MSATASDLSQLIAFSSSTKGISAAADASWCSISFFIPPYSTIMARDQRWPFIPFVILRSIQLLFAIIILGMTAYVVNIYPFWWASLGLFIALITIIWCIINFVIFFLGLLLPIAVVIVDAFITTFLLISMAGTAASGIVGSNCNIYDFSFTTYSYTYTYGVSTGCMMAKGSFAMELLGMFLFIATLVYSSITLHRTRKDLRGKKYNAGLPFVVGDENNDVQIENIYPAGDQKVDHEDVTIQPPQPIFVPQEQQVYQQGPTYEGFVSPPSSPPPPAGPVGGTGYVQQQSTGGTYVGTGYVQPQYSGAQQVQPQYSGTQASEMEGTHVAAPRVGNELPS